MDYSQTIRIHKTKFSKQDILNCYNNFFSTISSLNIEPIQLILNIHLGSKESYELDNIEDFKNEISSNDEIKDVGIIIFCGTDKSSNVYSITLSIIVDHSIITFRAPNKSWVDSTAFKYKEYLNIKGNKKAVEETAAITAFNNESWLRTHENLIIGIISILVTITIAILGWTIFKK